MLVYNTGLVRELRSARATFVIMYKYSSRVLQSKQQEGFSHFSSQQSLGFRADFGCFLSAASSLFWGEGEKGEIDFMSRKAQERMEEKMNSTHLFSPRA